MFGFRTTAAVVVRATIEEVGCATKPNVLRSHVSGEILSPSHESSEHKPPHPYRGNAPITIRRCFIRTAVIIVYIYSHSLDHGDEKAHARRIPKGIAGI